MKTSELTEKQIAGIKEITLMRGTFESGVAETILKTGNISYDQANVIMSCLDEELRFKVPITDINLNFHTKSSMRQRPSWMR